MALRKTQIYGDEIYLIKDCECVDINMISAIQNRLLSITLTLDELKELRKILNQLIMKMTFKTTTI